MLRSDSCTLRQLRDKVLGYKSPESLLRGQEAKLPTRFSRKASQNLSSRTNVDQTGTFFREHFVLVADVIDNVMDDLNYLDSIKTILVPKVFV